MRSTEQQLWPVLYIAPSASDSAAAFGVGVVAHVGRVLAAELELQLDHARAPARWRSLRRWHGEPVKNTPSTRCSSSAAPTSPPPTRALNTSSGTPASCSSRAMCQAGQRGELRRLVEHRVAGEQRRHEHVAADEVRVVPGRDVGDHAERLVGDALAHAAVVEHRLVGDARPRSAARKKSMRGSRPFSSLRDCADRLADLARQRGGQRARARRTSAARKRAIAAMRSRSGVAAQAGCAARAAAALAATLRHRRPGSSSIDQSRRWRGCEIGERGLMVQACSGARARPEEVVQQRRVVESSGSPGTWNSGCHCTAAT